MKKLSLLAIMTVILAPTLGLASGQLLAHCSGLEDARGTPMAVSIKEDTGGQLVALYTTESFGGGTQTFAYKVALSPQSLTDGALTYQGTNLKLAIYDHQGSSPFSGRLTVQDMKVVNRHVSCELY